MEERRLLQCSPELEAILGRPDDISRVIQLVRSGKIGTDEAAEHVPLAVVGGWYDTFTYPDGSREDGEFHDNLVVDSFAVLLTALCMTGRDPAYAGITHMALGQGDPLWDTDGLPAPQASDTTLVSEFARKALAEINDINTLNQVVTTGPTGRLLMTCTWQQNEAIGDIREFGLYGGRAADGFTLDQANQGLLVNHIIHGKIVKSLSSDFTFTRSCRLIF